MNSRIAQKLSKRIKFFRNERGLTQEEAAKKCGIKYKYYQEHESNNARDMRLSTMEKISEGLDVSLTDLFNFED
ncbi:MAG: helix-turn-helix transcriptional regulator [Candidatus Peribacteraceae bacterium]|nr:helix-turn-helix transcriptional regulator [Candidatus Peribacteraceae bacterium]